MLYYVFLLFLFLNWSEYYGFQGEGTIHTVVWAMRFIILSQEKGYGDRWKSKSMSRFKEGGKSCSVGKYAGDSKQGPGDPDAERRRRGRRGDREGLLVGVEPGQGRGSSFPSEFSTLRFKKMYFPQRKKRSSHPLPPQSYSYEVISGFSLLLLWHLFRERS